MKLKLDETVDELYVTHIGCKVPASSSTAESDCPSKVMYNPMKSNPEFTKDSQDPKMPTKVKTKYNMIAIHGYNYMDRVCLNMKVDTSCVAKQPFFSII